MLLSLSNASNSTMHLLVFPPISNRLQVKPLLKSILQVTLNFKSIQNNDEQFAQSLPRTEAFKNQNVHILRNATERQSWENTWVIPLVIYIPVYLSPSHTCTFVTDSVVRRCGGPPALVLQTSKVKPKYQFIYV